MSIFKKTAAGVTVLVIVAVLVFLAVNSLFVVQQNEYGVVWEFGAVEDVKDAPGLYFKVPFIQSVSTLPGRCCSTTCPSAT